MTITAKLFMSGRSQAIRLPAKLRLNAREVRIEQIGNALWVQPEPSTDQSMADWLTAFYKSSEPVPEGFLADRDDAPPQQREWS
ncbi:MAG: AbrB family transcriptional regulator [Comamonadaceae bacterium]|nr:MAG: AbrB family transcriptional regulator [Comamonadaceae bacterium]